METGAPALSKDELEELSEVQPFRWLRAAAWDWLWILAAIACCLRWPHWPVWAAAVAVIGNRQHALGVLMHDAVHYRVTGRQASNDILADLLAGHLLFLPTACYRAFHLPHHRYLDMPQDPEMELVRLFPKDLRFPQSPIRFVWVFLRDLSGLWPVGPLALARVVWRQPGPQRKHAIPMLLLHAGIVTAAAMAGWLHVYVLLWLLPLMTVFAATFRVRGITEHLGIEEAGPDRYVRSEPDILRTTRSVGGKVGTVLFGPHAVGRHLEHHLYPSVPFYNLPRLSKLLTERAPEQMKPRARSGYGEAIAECLGRPPTRERPQH